MARLPSETPSDKVERVHRKSGARPIGFNVNGEGAPLRDGARAGGTCAAFSSEDANIFFRAFANAKEGASDVWAPALAEGPRSEVGDAVTEALRRVGSPADRDGSTPIVPGELGTRLDLDEFGGEAA